MAKHTTKTLWITGGIVAVLGYLAGGQFIRNACRMQRLITNPRHSALGPLRASPRRW